MKAMAGSSLRLITRSQSFSISIPFSEKLEDHQAILQEYQDTHVRRNHSERTIASESRFLTGWFEGYTVLDPSHPDGERQLLIWEAMEPIRGRQRIIEFSNQLALAELQPLTRATYVGYLRRLFEY